MRIGITYGHVASNVGDLAINRGVVGLVNRIAPHAEVHVVLHNPNKRFLDLGKESFEGLRSVTFGSTPAPNDLDLAREYVNTPDRFLQDTGLSTCDIILYNSGEHLFSYADRPPRADMIWRVLPALAAKSAGIPFVSLPMTIGPFADAVLSDLARTYMQLNDAFAVRESESAKYAAELDAATPAPALLDPAFFAPIPESLCADDGKTLGIVMRLDGHGMRVGWKESSGLLATYCREGFSESRSFRFAVEASKRFLEEVDGNVVLFVQSSANDFDLTLAVGQALAQDGYRGRLRIAQPATVAEYQRQLAGVSFLVASRFHACILGLLSGRPVMGVYFKEHGHKMPGLFDFLKVPDYCHDLSSSSPKSVAQTVVPLFHERDSAYADMHSRLEDMRREEAEWLSEAVARAGRSERVLPDITSESDAYLRAIEQIDSTLKPAVPQSGSPSFTRRIVRKARSIFR